MEIQCRGANKSEYRKITILTDEAYKVPYKPGKMVTRANDNSTKLEMELGEGSNVFVAEINKQIVGTIRCRIMSQYALFYKLAVDPKYRCKGIGGKLIRHLFQYVRDQKINEVRIEVAEEKGLIPFYESFGFKISKRYSQKDHFEVLMIRTFTSNSA